MARVALNGIEIDYAVTGRGRPVILSHGYGATRRMWDGQHAALGDRYRLITWDMRGHGQTETPDDPAQYSTELTVSDLRALLQTLGISSLTVRKHTYNVYQKLQVSGRREAVAQAQALGLLPPP